MVMHLDFRSILTESSALQMLKRYGVSGSAARQQPAAGFAGFRHEPHNRKDGNTLRSVRPTGVSEKPCPALRKDHFRRHLVNRIRYIVP